MADFTQHNQFVSTSGSDAQDLKQCARLEALLADAVDGNLSPEEQQEVEAHTQSCQACAATLADAQRGASLLGTLRLHPPVPSADLLDRIFAQTIHAAGLPETQAGLSFLAPDAASGVERYNPPGTLAAQGSTPELEMSRQAAARRSGHVLPFRRPWRQRLQPLRETFLQPRLAMTAAMAFFSVALTLNLTGVHITALRPADLRPSALKRSFYEADAHIFRYYDNIRVVYELESRVHDLQRSDDVDAPATPVTEPGPTSSPATTTPAQPEQTTPPAGSPATHPHSRPGTSLREPLLPDRRLNAQLQPLENVPAGFAPPTDSLTPQEGDPA